MTNVSQHPMMDLEKFVFLSEHPTSRESPSRFFIPAATITLHLTPIFFALPLLLFINMAIKLYFFKTSIERCYSAEGYDTELVTQSLDHYSRSIGGLEDEENFFVASSKSQSNDLNKEHEEDRRRAQRRKILEKLKLLADTPRWEHQEEAHAQHQGWSKTNIDYGDDFYDDNDNDNIDYYYDDDDNEDEVGDVETDDNFYHSNIDRHFTVYDDYDDYDGNDLKVQIEYSDEDHSETPDVTKHFSSSSLMKSEKWRPSIYYDRHRSSFKPSKSLTTIVSDSKLRASRLLPSTSSFSNLVTKSNRGLVHCELCPKRE